MYNWWNSLVSCTASNPTQPVIPSPAVPLFPQYEFYTYPSNYAETGNEAVASVAAAPAGVQSGQSTLNSGNPAAYLGSFNAIAPYELYVVYPQFGPSGNNAYQKALSGYMTYLQGTSACGIGVP
jgi:hypothetical protein